MPEPNPGPWKTAGPYAVLDAKSETVATCPGPNKAANQALIAAAPELLAACKAAADVCRSLAGEPSDVGNMLLSAIAKARGVQH